MKTLKKVSIFVFMLMFPYFSLANAEMRPFTVEDGVNRARLYDVRQGAFQSDYFYITDDSKDLFVIVGRGVPQKKAFEFKLYMFNLEEISERVRSGKGSLPEGRVLFRTIYDRGSFVLGLNESGGIKRLWHDGTGPNIFFLAADEKMVFQVYRLNTDSGEAVKLTNGLTHVFDYAVLKKSDTLIYKTGVVPNNNDCSREYYRVGVRRQDEIICQWNELSLLNNYFVKQPSAAPAEVYSLRLNDKLPPVKILSNYIVYGSLSDAVLSPNGKNIILTVESKNSLDPSKEDVNLVSQESYRRAMSIYNEDIMERWAIFKYYVVANISGEGAHVLNTAPISVEENLGSAYWIDNDRILISGVAVDTAEMKAAKEAVYHTATRKYHHVKDNLNDIVLLNNSLTLGSRGEAVGEGRCNKTLYGDNDEFTSEDSCYVDNNKFKVRVYTGEKYNKMPDIWVKDLINGTSMRLLELNPQLNNVAMGDVRLFNWSDDSGRDWRGGLVYPPGYKAGRKYPLVVQTYGFDPNTYLMDGAYFATAPYAAQAIASRGIIVLQMPSVKFDKIAEEHPILARGVKSAIANLQNLGVIDEKKIGLVGYSALGSFVFNSIIFPDYELAAAVIADALSPSPGGYASTFSSPPPGMLTQELLACNSLPWGDTQGEWLKRNPYFHIDRMNTPLLLKEYTPVISQWWDVYTGLKRLKKPVDFYMYTRGGHPPLHMATITEAQEQVRDWFDFWLNGKENGDEGRKEEYAIWRGIRESRSLLSVQKNQISRLSRMDCPNLNQMHM